MKKNHPMELYEGWYSKGGYPLYPDGMKFIREGPPQPRYILGKLYKGVGLPAVPEVARLPKPAEKNLIPLNPIKELQQAEDLGHNELISPRYGCKIWLKPEKKEVNLNPYIDEDGLPINPDGSARLVSLAELYQLSVTHPQPVMSSSIPKHTKRSRYKVKKRKNPPPSKVDMEKLFREEKERLERMEEYK